jgi:hypothetical protein
LNPHALTGLALLALSLASTERKKFRFDREIPVEKTTQRGERHRSSSREPERGRRHAPYHRDAALVLGPQPPKHFEHRHVFVLGGVEVLSSQTFLHGQNPSKHAHLVLVPTVVKAKGMNRRLKVNMSTTFDEFGPGHTHKLATRGRVFISGGPVR